MPEDDVEIPDSATEDLGLAQPEAPPPAAETKPPAEPAPKKEEPKPPAEPAPQRTGPTKEELIARREELLRTIERAYGLPKEDVEALLDHTKVAEILPRYAARLFVDVYETLYGILVGQLPYLVGNLIHQWDSARQVQDRFFQKWPQLKDPKHAQVIQRIAAAYRAANPTADLETFINEVGAQAALAVGALKLVDETARGGQQKPFNPVLGGSPPASKPKPQLSPEEAAIADLLE